MIKEKGCFFHPIHFLFDPHWPLIWPDRLNDSDSSWRLRHHLSRTLKSQGGGAAEERRARLRCAAGRWDSSPSVATGAPACTAAPVRLSFAGFVGNAFNMSRLSGDILALLLIKCWIRLDGRRLVGLRSISGRQWTLWRHWLGSDGCKMLPLTTARRDWMLGSCCSVALLIFCLFDVNR